MFIVDDGTARLAGMVDDADLQRAIGLVGEAQRITVLTGAGVSTDSGIPDFRGPNGLWTRNPDAEKASNIEYYLADAELRKRVWKNRLEMGMFTAQPNACHHALFRLEQRGKLDAVITQNVDGLHHAAGHHPDRVIEVHGTVHYARCYQCSDRRPMGELLDRVRAGESDPPCERCGGIVKSDTILFGQSLIREVIDSAFDSAQRCDLLIAAGSSLSVFPAANLVPVAREHGAQVVIVNGEPTGMDAVADLVLRGDLAPLLTALCG